MSISVKFILYYYSWITYANAYGQKPRSVAQCKHVSSHTHRCNATMCMINHSAVCCSAARRCYASVVKVKTSAALCSWQLWLCSRVRITYPGTGFFPGGSPHPAKILPIPPYPTLVSIFGPRLVPPPAEVRPRQFEKYTFLCQIWLLLSSKVPLKAVFHA